MPSTVPSARRSMPLNTLETIRPTPIKAAQARSSEPSEVESRTGARVREALRRTCGSVKAASIDMRIDLGQLSNELKSGKFKFERLDLLSDEQQAKFFKCLHEECEPLTSPLGRLRELRRQQESIINEVMQIAEGMVG